MSKSNMALAIKEALEAAGEQPQLKLDAHGVFMGCTSHNSWPDAMEAVADNYEYGMEHIADYPPAAKAGFIGFAAGMIVKDVLLGDFRNRELPDGLRQHILDAMHKAIAELN